MSCSSTRVVTLLRAFLRVSDPATVDDLCLDGLIFTYIETS